MFVATPNVNFFIHSVPCLDGYGVNDKLYQRYRKERLFYSCRDNYNYLNYVNNGSEKKIDFVDYSGNHEKSTGLFDKNGLCSKEQLAELKKGFRNTKSPIWHGLISFEEFFGKKYCNDYESAYNLMLKKFPKFLKQAGFDPNNIVWCAGLHTNTDHRHIHYSFYEKEPLKYRKTKKELCFSYGLVSQYSINKIKIDIESYLTNSKINEKIYTKRQELTEKIKKNIKKTIKKGESLKMLKKILILLPSDGRVSYDSENMIFLKNDINHLIDLIIKQDDKTNAVFRTFLTLLQEKDNSIRRMCANSKIDSKKVVLYDKYLSDLYRRLGNIAIKNILSISNEIKHFDIQVKSRLAKKRLQRRKDEYIFDQSMRLSEKVQQEAMDYFAQHMKVLEEMKIKVLIEQGIIEL